MRESWTKTKLEDVTSLLGDGLHGTPQYDEKGDYYFVNGNNLQNGRIVIKDDTKRISENEYQKIRKNLNDRTILVAINGTLGNVGVYKGEKIALGKSACYFNVNPNVDKQFIKYIIVSPLFQMYAPLYATGATIKNLSLKAMRNFSFPLPPLPTQQKIAQILSAYDDLIENNLKRIKLLEEMAQQTYEEWFVRMKFPNHKTTPIDAETGLPEGWTKQFCIDVMEVLSGGTPKTSIEGYWNGDIQFFTPKDATNGIYSKNTEKRVTSLGLEKCNSKLYPKDTLFITARGTVGKLNLASEAMAMNQSCYALKAKEGLTQYFLYCSLSKTIDAFKGAANGGVFDTIVVDTFRYLPFIKPSLEVVGTFNEKTTPIFKNIKVLLEKNTLLKEARDILLPRLMTGIIDVDKIKTPSFKSPHTELENA